MKIDPGKIIKSKPQMIKEGPEISLVILLLSITALLLTSCSIKGPKENLLALDETDSIVWWEFQEDSLIIWTEEDEKKADLERFRYIDSIYRYEDSTYQYDAKNY